MESEIIKQMNAYADERDGIELKARLIVSSGLEDKCSELMQFLKYRYDELRGL